MRIFRPTLLKIVFALILIGVTFLLPWSLAPSSGICPAFGCGPSVRGFPLGYITPASCNDLISSCFPPTIDWIGLVLDLFHLLNPAVI